MNRTAPLAPAENVQVWVIQALLIDDKPRTFMEIEQHIGSNPQVALSAMIDTDKVEAITVEGVTFWRRKQRGG